MLAVILLVATLLLLGYQFWVLRQVKKRARALERKKYDALLLSVLEKHGGEHFDFRKMMEAVVGQIDDCLDHVSASYLLVLPKEQLVSGVVVETEANEAFVQDVQQKMLASLESLLDKKLTGWEHTSTVAGNVLSEGDQAVLVKSYFHIPLLLFGEIAGVLTLASTKQGLYNFETVLPLYASTNSFLGALTRIQGSIGNEDSVHAKMEREFRRRMYQTEVLKELSERIGYSLDLAKIIEIITGSVGQLLDYHLIAYVVESNNKVLFKCDIEEPVNHQFVRDIREKMLASFSAMLGRTFKEDEIDESVSGAIMSDELKESVNSFFNLPLIIGGKAVGLITVASPKPNLYNEEETAVLYTIANQASTAVSRLNEVLEREKGKLNSLVTSLNDGIVMFDPHWNVLVINTAARQLLKITKENVGIYDVFDTLSGKIDVRTQVEKAISSNATIPPTVITLGDITLQVVILQVQDKENKNLGAVVVFHDITDETAARKIIEQKAAELEILNQTIEEQKESAESILRFLRSIGEGIFATDSAERIIFMNDAAEGYVGKTSAFAQGKKFHETFTFYDASDAPFIETLFNKVFQEKKSVSLPDKVYLRVGEKKIPVAGTLSPIVDDKKTMTGVIAVFQDVTKKHELEQMKNSFLTVAAHKLRTPLGSMRWTMELLLNGDLGVIAPEAQAGIKEVYTNSQRMLTLVNALLEVSDSNAKHEQETQQMVDLATILRSTVEKMMPEAKERGVTLTFHEPAQPLPLLSLPPVHITEAIENLISNGLKYNHRGGMVTVSVTGDQEAVLVNVSDTGIGIPKEDHAKIFTKFFRSANAAQMETEGSGLGLSMVKSHIEEAHATVWFESEENVGTTFFIKFPREQDPVA